MGRSTFFKNEAILKKVTTYAIREILSERFSHPDKYSWGISYEY